MTNQELSLLLYSMEVKRKEMYDISRVEGLDSPNVLKTSKELDELINKYDRIKQHKNFPERNFSI